MTYRFPALIADDLIRIVAPAKAIEKDFVSYAANFLESQGFRVKIGTHTLGKFSYLSGKDSERMADLQETLDDPECKAILCARGGYGSMRIVNKLNWAGFVQQPKWIIGFSDITIFHSQTQAFNLPSMHAPMPLNFQNNSKQSLQSLIDVLQGKPNNIEYQADHGFFKEGMAHGKLIGGNLAVMHALLGTTLAPDFNNNILFIEDIGEHLYAIDRMLYSLDLAGVFDKISGLIIGGLTNISDSNPPLGFTLEELIKEKTWFRGFPVCMNFPSGHIIDNRALILGYEALLNVGKQVQLVQN
jgi:muramoyltetrapeptide carboxypeptidase